LKKFGLNIQTLSTVNRSFAGGPWLGHSPRSKLSLALAVGLGRTIVSATLDDCARFDPLLEQYFQQITPPGGIRVRGQWPAVEPFILGARSQALLFVQNGGDIGFAMVDSNTENARSDFNLSHFFLTETGRGYLTAYRMFSMMLSALPGWWEINVPLHNEVSRAFCTRALQRKGFRRPATHALVDGEKCTHWRFKVNEEE